MLVVEDFMVRPFNRTRDETSRARELRRDVSKTERRLWPHLRAGKLGAPFRRQYPIGGYFADYCCVPLKLIVEIDGPTHGVVRDAARDFAVSQMGFDTIRFSVQEIDEGLEGIVSTIHNEVQLRLKRADARV
jgi:very-short-patch-repair endonuclease